MAQARSRLIILLKSFIALERSLSLRVSESSWVSQRRNVAAMLRRIGVFSLLAQELLSAQTSPTISGLFSDAASLLLSSASISSGAPFVKASVSSDAQCSPLQSSLLESSSSCSSSLPSSISSSLSSSVFSSSSSLSLSSSSASAKSAFFPVHRPPTVASPSSLPSGVHLCFQEIKHAAQELKVILEDLEERSSLWQVVQHECLARELHKLTRNMADALSILPLHLLQVSDEIKEQIYLTYSHLRRLQKPFIDPAISALHSKLLELLDHEDLESIDTREMQRFFLSLHLSTPADFEREIELLRKEICNQAGTGGIPVMCVIESSIRFMKQCQRTLYSKKAMGIDSPRGSGISTHTCADDVSMTSYNILDSPMFPDEFKCPISLDLMHDPVVVATGHTFDRVSISKWVESGHKTCPKSGQHLLHMNFIPNHAMRRILQQWSKENGVPYKSAEEFSRESEDEDHISLRQAALDQTTKDTVPFLVGKLATGSLDVQRQAAYELRLMTKCGIENRICIAEAGAIPFLVRLLTSSDERTQENVVTTLLNLSICENNKSLIMAAGALDAVVEVVKAGATMEARENAAATLFSLSMVHGYKAAIGSKPDAIPALVALIREGSSQGKKDAATALFNLCVVGENKVKIMEAGAIPVLVDTLNDEKAGITDKSLSVLAVLAETRNLCAVIDQAKAIPMLVDLLRLGSARGKENALAVLLALCKYAGERAVERVVAIKTVLPSLQNIAEIGSARARRKAYCLLELFNKRHYSSQELVMS